MPSTTRALYPAFLDLTGARVLIVGGGPVAARKAGELLRCGAKVDVVAKAFDTSFAALKGAKGLRTSKRAYRASDLKGARLVFAATDDPALNTRIAQAAQKRGVWVNAAAPPEAGDLVVPGIVRKGRWTVAVSTGGTSAAAAKSLRQALDGFLDAAWSQFLALLESRRKRVKKVVPDPAKRRKLLQQLGDGNWVELIRREGRAEAAKKMDWMIEQAQPKAKRSAKTQRRSAKR